MPSMWTTKQKYLEVGMDFMTRSISRAFVHMYTNRLVATMRSTISSIWGCIVGSPPAIETMGAPESSTACMHCSTVSMRSITASYSRMRPHPSQARLQASSGSSMVTRGNFLRRAALFFITYQPRRTASSIGLVIRYVLPSSSVA